MYMKNCRNYFANLIQKNPKIEASTSNIILLSGNFYNGLFRVSLKREKRIEKYTILYHPNSKELEFNKHYYSNHEILKVLKFFSNQLLQMWISSLNLVRFLYSLKR